ncbi:MAG: hypothetical protein D4R69_03335, partial [Actinomycetales bacterium]
MKPAFIVIYIAPESTISALVDSVAISIPINAGFIYNFVICSSSFIKSVSTHSGTFKSSCEVVALVLPVMIY